MNTSFDRVATVTLQNHGKEIFDNITTNNAFLYMLKKRDNIRVVSGGRALTHPLYYLVNTSFKSYAKLDVIDTPIMDDITRAEYPIKTVAGSLVISTVEEAMNAGDREKLLDLADEVRMAAELSMSEVLGDQVWKDGLADKDFDGLQNLVSDTPSTQTDVGGINPSSYSYWRNQVDTNTVTRFNTSNEGLTAMNSLLNSCTFGARGPRCVITTKTVYGLYEIGLTGQIRYATTELADAGFLHLAYTTMPVLFDDNCPSAHLYMVDTDSLWLQVLSKGNMEVTPFQPSHNQLSRTALMYLIGNLTTGSRRTNGVITTISG
jgi:hypothetical protein